MCDFLNDADFYYQERFSAQEIFEKRRRRWPIQRNSDTKKLGHEKNRFSEGKAQRNNIFAPRRMTTSPDQFELSFSEESLKPDGAAAWRAEWSKRAEELCQRLGVPLNHQAEVRLQWGPVLRGRLYLAEEQLWFDGDRHKLLLRIDQTTFHLNETESVLRLDAL